MAVVLEANSARDPVPGSSDRSFGLVFAGLFTIVAFWPLLRHESLRWWALVVAITFLLFALFRPHYLHSLNRAWLAFGNLLHRVVSPIVMGTMFFVCVTPIAWFLRRRGTDLLSLAPRPDLPSYWIVREPSAPESVAMKRQF